MASSLRGNSPPSDSESRVMTSYRPTSAESFRLTVAFSKISRESWWVRSRSSALEDRNTFPPARRDRRAGGMAGHERKIMKKIHALRNSGNGLSRRRGSILVPLGLVALLTILAKAQAVSPAPDGGYAGVNTAEGKTPSLA